MKFKVDLKKNRTPITIVSSTIAICLFLLFKNKSTEGFWYAGITDIITLLFACLIAVFISERGNNIRRRNDCIEHIIDYVETFVTNDNSFSKGQNTLLLHVTCANRIKYLKDANFADINEEVEFIDQHFQELRELYSNHYNNKEAGLEMVKKDMDRHRALIIDKCNKIRVNLYK